MTKHLKTEADFDRELHTLDGYIESIDKEHSKLIERRRVLEQRKMERFDPEYRQERLARRKAKKERKQLIDDAKKKFVGKWLFIDDGTYIHVAAIDDPNREAATNTALCPGQLVFPTHYDIKVETGDGEARITNAKAKDSIVYLTLYTEDVLKVTKKDMMEDLAGNVADINASYRTLCKKIKWTPGKDAT